MSAAAARPSAFAQARAAAPVPVTLADFAGHHGDATCLLHDGIESGLRPFAWQVDPRIQAPAVLALDLGARSGWCFAERGRYEAGMLPHTSGVRGPWVDALGKLLARFACLVLVEDAHPRPINGSTIALQSISRYVGAALALAALNHLPAVRVQASTWQSKILGKHKRDAGKTLAMRTARLHFGGAITSEDVADAACLAIWGRGGRL